MSNVKTDASSVQTENETPLVDRNKVVDKLVVKTNRAGDNVTKAQRKLFEVVRECVREMNGDKDELSAYKKGVKQSHRSTVFVMMKVASFELFNRLEDQLPKSYQTLYEMLKLANQVGEERFVELLDEGFLHNESTKANVAKCRKDEAVVTADTNTSEVMTVEEKEAGEVMTVDVVAEDVMSLSNDDRYNLVERVVDTFTLDELETLRALLEMKVDGAYDYQEAA